MKSKPIKFGSYENLRIKPLPFSLKRKKLFKKKTFVGFLKLNKKKLYCLTILFSVQKRQK